MHKILVIDNEYAIVELIKDMLTIHGFQVKTALTGMQGINTAVKFHPDLVLCDIAMPEISGYDVLETLRNDKRTHAIPFVFLTAKGGMQDLRKGMRMGADDYLTKPVSSEELIAAVNTRLKKHQQVTSHFRDEIEKTKHHLEIIKNYDEITGLPKRVMLENKLTFSSKNQSLKVNTALLILKFNRFKNIIDILPKKDVKFLINEILHRIEFVTNQEKNVFFLDDGTFGVLLPEISFRKKLTPLVKKILANIRKPIRIDNREINCSVSIGIAYSGKDPEKPAKIIQNAELALNAALEEGYNTFRFFENEIIAHAIDRFNLESALHKALEKNEFKIFYQPKIDSVNKKMIGSEALIRWENVDYGLISPTQFIPIAEENGLIIPIGEWLFESVCSQLNEWKIAGLNPKPIAINISARQLEQKNFVKSVSSILEKSNIDNELLEIELTESILIKNSQKISKKLVMLRKQGIKVSIDDFGTGYSSLAYLSSFPFDKLKIDQSFIRDITTDKAAASLATSIISMAHSLGVRVIAEGVETEDQVNFLCDYKCDEIQGYFYSKPLPAEEFEEFLREKYPTC